MLFESRSSASASSYAESDAMKSSAVTPSKHAIHLRR